MNNVSVKAMDLLKDRILKLGKDGSKLKSLKEVYNLWVDCNEDAYAEYVFSKDYSELNGRLG